MVNRFTDESREDGGPTKLASERLRTAWGPFQHKSFSVIWTETVVSNIGSWMYSAASGWLMTSLSPSPLIVSMVQVATTLPMFLFALLAGAFADIADRRKLLISAEVAATVFSAALGPDWLVAAGTIGTAVAMTLFRLAHDLFFGVLVSVIAGVSWIAVLSSLNISARVALPDWVRGRGLAMFVTVLSGTYDWGVFEDPAVEGRFIETFLTDSWLEHLRHHERVTNADRVLQKAVDRFHTKGAPKVTHLVAADNSRS